MILNAASFSVSASLRLSLWTFKQKLGSQVKISGKQTPSRNPSISNLKCRHFLYNISSLYILSHSYTSKNMLGVKYVRYG